jgi:hypothetical protein
MAIFRRIMSRIFKFAVTLGQTANALATVLTILAFLGIGSVGYGYITHTLPEAVIGSVVFLFTIFLFILFYTLLEEKIEQLPGQGGQTNARPVATDTKIYPAPPKEDEVELLSKEIVYEYASDGRTMCQRKRLHIRALRNGVPHFTDRYSWTGNGTCDIRSLTPGFIINNQRKQEIWNYFDINFPHPLRIGQEADFTIEWELFDEKGVAIPFLSTMIDRETKHLLLRVILPPELAPTRAYCYEFANYIETLPETTQEIKWSQATRSLSYDVPHPKRNHKYLIRWYNE